MWILYAFGSALFAGITSILAKCGIKQTDSNVATAIRTIVVLLFAWIMVFVVGSQGTLSSISAKSLTFLILSGVATGASWLCYFRALQIGDVNKVVSIDKSSTVLTIILAFIILGEKADTMKITGAVAIGAGTYLMIQKNTKAANGEPPEGKAWLVYAFLSALFASLTAIFVKIGIENVESNLGTAIRTVVVLIMSWIVVFTTRSGKKHSKGRASVHLPFRPGHRSLVALLLQGPARRACQCGCSDRQAQHFNHRSFFQNCFW